MASDHGRHLGVPEASFEEAYPRRHEFGRGHGRHVAVVPGALGHGSRCPPGTPSSCSGTCSATATTAATLASGSRAGGSDGGPTVTMPSEESRRGVQRGATSSQGQLEQVPIFCP